MYFAPFQFVDPDVSKMYKQTQPDLNLIVSYQPHQPDSDFVKVNLLSQPDFDATKMHQSKNTPTTNSILFSYVSEPSHGYDDFTYLGDILDNYDSMF